MTKAVSDFDGAKPRVGKREATRRAGREAFCSYLREARKARDMTLGDISRVTRIPERSLSCLEDGRFEELRADVFARGFVRSYAQCVGLDAEDAVSRYAKHGLEPAPVTTADPDRLGWPRADTSSVAVRRIGAKPAPAVEPEPVEASTPAPEPEPEFAGDSTPEPVEAAAPAIELDTDAALGSDESPKVEASPARAEVKPSAQPSSSPAARTQTKKRKRKSAAERRRRRQGNRRGPKKHAARHGTQTEAKKSAPRSEAKKSAAAAEAKKSAPRSEAKKSAAAAEAQKQAPVTKAKKSASSAKITVVEAKPAPDPETAEPKQASRRGDDSIRRFFLPVSPEGEDPSRRGALTLAVIILVIVATLTMTMLLRRPSPQSDGVTRPLPHQYEPGGLDLFAHSCVAARSLGPTQLALPEGFFVGQAHVN